MTIGLTIRFRAPQADSGTAARVLPEGAHQFRLLPDGEGYLLPDVLLDQDGSQGHLTAHLPARLEITPEDGPPVPDRLPVALRAMWAPLEADRIPVDGTRVLSSGARLPLHLVQEPPEEGTEPATAPVTLLVSWRVRYSGATASGTAHESVILEFWPPGSPPPPMPSSAHGEPFVLRRASRIPDHGRVVAVDFGTTASTATVIDTRRISDQAVDSGQKETLAQALGRITEPPSDAPEAWTRELERLRAERIVLDRRQQRGLTGAEALGRLGEAEVATAVLLRIERIRRHADPTLRAWLVERLHQAYTQTVTTPALDFNTLFPVPYPDGHGGATFAPATALREAEGDLDRPGVSRYGDHGFELCAEDAGGLVGLKRALFEKPVTPGDQGDRSPVHLAQHMFHLLVDRAERAAHGDGLGEPGPVGTALVTYPTSAHPETRARLQDLVRIGLSLDTVELTIDEGLAAGLYFLMRDLSANLDQGVEALRAASRPVPGRPGTWQRIMLVVDIGGGTTDIALLELTLRDVTVSQKPEQAFVSGRDYLVEPRILGTIGHGQLGGDLLTLQVLYWIKARIVDSLGRPGGKTRTDGKSLSAQVAEQVRDHRESLVSNAVREELQRLLPTHWIPAPGEPALDQTEQTVRQERFRRLWRLAEEAKRVLGQEDKPFTVELADLLALTEAGTPLPGKPSSGVELPVAEFRMLVEPVLEQAATMAATLVADAFRRIGRDRAEAAERHLPAPPEPVLDQVVLSGRTSAMKAVRRALEAQLLAAHWTAPGGGGQRQVAWNPAQLFTETGFLAKQATSIGVAWAHVMSGYRGLRADLRRQNRPTGGIHASELGIVTGGLFACLPCDFHLGSQTGGGVGLFESGTPYREISADGTLGLRSGWNRVVRRIEVHRPRAGSKAIQWGIVEVVRRAQAAGYRLQRPAWDFDGDPEVRFQIEIDNQLNLFVDFCHGAPCYHVGAPGAREDGSVLSLSGAADGALRFDAALGTLSVPGAICASPAPLQEHGYALTEVFPAWVRSPRGGGSDLDYLPELFCTTPEPEPQIPPVPGRIRSLELSAPGGFLYFYLRRPAGEPAYLGRLAVPPANPLAARDIFQVSLDAAGRLRLHRGEVPYPQVGALGEIEDHPGWVYRTPMQRGLPDFEPRWDPNTGRH